MILLSLEPESSASANSAIPAYEVIDQVINHRAITLFPLIFTRSVVSEAGLKTAVKAKS